jgi:hypothetical protein
MKAIKMKIKAGIQYVIELVFIMLRLIKYTKNVDICRLNFLYRKSTWY